MRPGPRRRHLPGAGRNASGRRCARRRPDGRDAFVNADWIDSTGYSGKPIEILVGPGADGKIAGAQLIDHHEPIILIGIRPARIADFIKGRNA